jgi:PIN domain nuclease of toxin-antitoxin system
VRVLLDTHTLIWSLLDERRLSELGRELLSAPGHDIMISIVSVWEIAIKQGLGKLAPPFGINQILKNSDLVYLPITPEHCHAYSLLPVDGQHRDPFDRMLAVQAMVEDARLLSKDAAFDRYELQRIW